MPARCWDLERRAREAGYPVSWARRQGVLWELEVFCTVSQIEELEGGPKAA
jgi:hypothetical protein